MHPVLVTLSLVSIALLATVAFILRKSTAGVRILMYHNIGIRGSDVSTDYDDLFVSPVSFERQLRYLRFTGHAFISVDQLVGFLYDRVKLPRKSVLVSFDDGFADNYTGAFPLLNKYGAPAVVFLIERYIGARGVEWNRQKNDFLTPEQIALMRSGGVDFGGHTATHPSLRKNLGVGELHREIIESKRLIENRLNFSLTAFAYPYGSYTPVVKGIVQKAGYRCAVSLHNGMNFGDADPFALRRIKPSNNHLAFIVQIAAAPFVEWLRGFRRRLPWIK